MQKHISLDGGIQMKKTYEKLSIVIVPVAVKDIITTSGFDGDEYPIPGGDMYPL